MQANIQLGFELYGTFGVEGEHCAEGSLLQGVTFHWSMEMAETSVWIYRGHVYDYVAISHIK